LLGGNHEEINRWHLQKTLEKPRRNRPDLLTAAPPILGELDFLQEFDPEEFSRHERETVHPAHFWLGGGGFC